MIRSFFNLLLIAFLALALPIKGIASVTMLGCVSHTASINDAPADSHSHAAMAADHDHPQSDQGLSGGPHQLHGAQSDSLDSHGDANSKCGSCAPCNAGAALISSVLVAASDQPGDTDFPASASLHPSGRNTRLDRPPRQYVA